jgi:hypothetical protein
MTVRKEHPISLYPLKKADGTSQMSRQHVNLADMLLHIEDLGIFEK